MSAWDDSWGYHSGPTSGSPAGVTLGKIRATSGTGRCVNTDPLLAPDHSLVYTEETSVASATILRLPIPRDPRDPFVICDECGWMRWEHQERPEHCQALQ